MNYIISTGLFSLLALSIFIVYGGDFSDMGSPLYLVIMVVGWIANLGHIFYISKNKNVEVMDSEIREDAIGLAEQNLEFQKERHIMAQRLLYSQSENNKFLNRFESKIRESLNSMTGAASLLAQTPLNDRQINYLKTIDDNSNGLLIDLIEESSTTKNEDSGITLKVKEFNLNVILERVVETANILIKNKDIDIRVDVTPQLPPLLYGDASRIEQIILALVRNAIQFTQKGLVNIVVDTDQLTSHSLVLKINIKDTGIGISAQRIEHINEQGKKGSMSLGGLGIAMSYRLLNLMRGHLSIKSELDVGSDIGFCIRLGTSLSNANDSKTSKRLLDHLDVLVVDDNQLSRDIIANAFVSIGLNVVSVDGGESALTAIKEKSDNGGMFDVLALDWLMPNLDGIEVAMKVREMKNLIKQPLSILISAYSEDNPPSEQQLSGVIDAVLPKPLDTRVLTSTLMTFYGDDMTDVLHDQNINQDTNQEKDTFPEGIRILLAEDNFINQQIILDMVKSFGIECLLAEDGHQALKILETETVNAVLMDIEMPEMDGLEACVNLRKDERLVELPVIALTAHTQSEDEEKCIAAGMNDFISKPVDIVSLRTILYRWTVG